MNSTTPTTSDTSQSILSEEHGVTTPAAAGATSSGQVAVDPTLDKSSKSDTAPVQTTDDAVEDGQDNTKAEKRKQKQIEWASTSLNIDNIRMNPDKSSIVAIGGQDFNKITIAILIVFARKIGVTVKNADRKRSRLEEIIVAMAKGEAYRAAVLEGPTKRKNKKSSRSTKPSALNLDGTLYRAINAITCESGRGLFCLTRKQHSRQDVDSKKAHQSSWDGMHGIYSDSGNEDIGKLSGPALVGHKVDTNIASEYDELNVDEFQEVVLFILSHFKSARNRKNTSGQHKPFNNFIDGKSWILYFHNVIESVGDKALGDCTYAELDNDVKVTSDKVHATENTLRRRRSPSPPSTSQSKKD